MNWTAGYHAGFREGWKARTAAAGRAGLPSTLPLSCCAGRLELDYEQLTPWGPMPAAMEIHAGDCPRKVQS